MQLVRGIDIVSAMGGKMGSLRTTTDYQERFNCPVESADIDEKIEKYSDRSVQ